MTAAVYHYTALDVNYARSYVQRFGDEPRVLFASASIALFGVLRHTSLGA